MAGEKPKNVRWLRIRERPDFQSQYMEGTLVKKTESGTIYLSFYVERPAVETKFSVEVQEDGSWGGLVEGKADADGVIVEVQQGILLSLDEARALRDKLDALLPKKDDQKDDPGSAPQSS